MEISRRIIWNLTYRIIILLYVACILLGIQRYYWEKQVFGVNIVTIMTPKNSNDWCAAHLSTHSDNWIQQPGYWQKEWPKCNRKATIDTGLSVVSSKDGSHHRLQPQKSDNLRSEIKRGLFYKNYYLKRMSLNQMLAQWTFTVAM